jgi:hypothetical protein
MEACLIYIRRKHIREKENLLKENIFCWTINVSSSLNREKIDFLFYLFYSLFRIKSTSGVEEAMS